ncbi:hypothetical protein V2G26_020195 [Clonostachys chloroleuca]
MMNLCFSKVARPQREWGLPTRPAYSGTFLPGCDSAKKTERLADAKPRNPMLGKKIYPNGLPPFLPHYEDLHDTPFKPISRQEERRVLETVDAIMSQVRKELDKFDPGAIDLLAVEHNIRSYCILRAAYTCRAVTYGDDMKELEQMRKKLKEHSRVALGVTHGAKNKLEIRQIIEKDELEALYYRKTLKPCDIKLGTYFEEDPSQYRFIGLT